MKKVNKNIEKNVVVEFHFIINKVEFHFESCNFNDVKDTSLKDAITIPEINIDLSEFCFEKS